MEAPPLVLPGFVVVPPVVPVEGAGAGVVVAGGVVGVGVGVVVVVGGQLDDGFLSSSLSFSGSL